MISSTADSQFICHHRMDEVSWLLLLPGSNPVDLTGDAPACMSYELDPVAA